MEQYIKQLDDEVEHVQSAGKEASKLNPSIIIPWYSSALDNMTRHNDYPTLHSLFLKELHKVILELGSYMRNLVHTQHAFLQEDGLFESEITATTKLALGYYQYARSLCRALLKTEASEAAIKGIACFVQLIAMPEYISTAEHFSFFQRLRQESNQKDLSGLVSIRIRHQSTFHFANTRRALTHEVFHHVGNRKRAERADAIVCVLSRWLCNLLVFDCSFAWSPNDGIRVEDAKLIEAFFKETKPKRDGERKKRVDELYEQAMKVVIWTLKSEFGKDMDLTHLFLIKDHLARVFVKLLQGKREYSDDDGKKEFDFSVNVLNYNIELRKHLLSSFITWYSQQSVANAACESNVYAFIRRVADSRLGYINKYIAAIQIAVNKLLSGMPTASSIYEDLDTNFDVNPPKEELKRREPDPKKDSNDYDLYSKNWPSIEKMVNIVCDATVEAFCDAAMLQLLQPMPTFAKYLENICYNPTQQRGEADAYRVYLVYWVIFAKKEWDAGYHDQAIKEIGRTASYLVPLIDYLGKTVKEFSASTLKENELFKSWEDDEEAFINLFELAQSLRNEHPYQKSPEENIANTLQN